MKQLEVGDVVRLKSGGPRMTVIEILNDGALRTAWFVSDDDCERNTFPAAALKSCVGEKEDGEL